MKNKHHQINDIIIITSDFQDFAHSRWANLYGHILKTGRIIEIRQTDQGIAYTGAFQGETDMFDVLEYQFDANDKFIKEIKGNEKKDKANNNV